MDAQKTTGRDTLLNILKTTAAHHLRPERADQFIEFVANAMNFYPDASYLARPATHIFHSLFGLFVFAVEGSGSQSPSSARVKVFNPQPEVDGWLSAHTSIYVNQRDMPFLVDSLRMALNRRGLNIFTLQSNPVWVSRSADGGLLHSNRVFFEGAHREAFIAIEIDLHRICQLVLPDFQHHTVKFKMIEIVIQCICFPVLAVK